MFKEIKVIEEHFQQDDAPNTSINEIKNSNGKLGSVELLNIESKFKYLINQHTTSYPCRKYTNVTIFVTTYLFSSINSNPKSTLSL